MAKRRRDRLHVQTQWPARGGLVLAVGAVLLGVAVLAGCSVGRSPEPTMLMLDRQESILFRGREYLTLRRGVAVAEADLIPIGEATLGHTAVIDPAVWALPGIDPARLIVVRTPPAFEEPGWNVGEFIYFTGIGVTGTVLEACDFYSDPTPGCQNMYPSPSPSDQVRP